MALTNQTERNTEMDRGERDSFFRDLAEKFQEINDTFDDYGLDAPSKDCEDKDVECTIPDDHDIVTLHKLLREANVLLEDFIN